MADNEDKSIAELNELLAKTDKDELAIVEFGSGTTNKITSVNLITKLDYADGFVVKYDTTTSISITSGEMAANGKVYNLSADTTHTMTSLASAFDMHYIYIDDSASTVPDAFIIDSTDEPVFSDSKRGFYNGDDKCIGAVASTDGASTLITFTTLVVSPNYIKYNLARTELPFMAASMNPNGSWQTPNMNDGSVVTPVNAISITGTIGNTDSGTLIVTNITNFEFAAIETVIGDGQNINGGFDFMSSMFDITLGPSRNIKVGGSDNDDNALSVLCTGFGILR